MDRTTDRPYGSEAERVEMIELDPAIYPCACPHHCGCASLMYWPSTMCRTCYDTCEL